MNLAMTAWVAGREGGRKQVIAKYLFSQRQPGLLEVGCSDCNGFALHRQLDSLKLPHLYQLVMVVDRHRCPALSSTASTIHHGMDAMAMRHSCTEI